MAVRNEGRCETVIGKLAPDRIAVSRDFLGDSIA